MTLVCVRVTISRSDESTGRLTNSLCYFLTNLMFLTRPAFSVKADTACSRHE